MQFIRSFFKRITDDLKQKKLIPLKILFFVHASTLFVLYPYLTIHMRELGINVEETAIMSAVTPVVSIVMPPLAGLLADKIGNFRCLLALSSVLGGASALLLLAVPVGRITVTFPSSVQLMASCGAGDLRMQQVQNYPCTPRHPYSYDVNITTSTCGFVCELPQEVPIDEGNTILNSHSYEVHLQSPEKIQRLIYRHTMSSMNSHMMTPKKDQSTVRILTNDPFFNTTITKISDRVIFFPTPTLYEMECSRGINDTNVTCIFGIDDITTENQRAGNGPLKARISHEISQNEDEKEQDQDESGVNGIKKYYVNKVTYASNITKFGEEFDDIDFTTCKDNLVELGEVVKVQAGSNRLTRCSSACAVTVPRKELCANQQQQLELDPAFTFWCYLAVRVFIGIIGGTAFAMFEGAVIAIVREQKADYGLQRVYGSIGGMISSPLSGLLIDYASRGKGYTDFRPAFYLYAVLKIASGALMLSIDLEFKQPAQNVLEDVIHVFKNVEIVALFIACFIMGTAWGYIESFLFWLLQDLGASRSLMGITITVGGIAGLPLLVLSGPIIRRLGHANVLFIGFIFYAIRLLGYSLIYNPWLCLIFEALESVTSSLSFTACVTYAARLSSTTTDTSVQGLLGGLYYGVGKGAGSLIGGYLMKFFGTRPTYQIFSAATFITGCMYFIFNYVYIRKRAASDATDLYKKKPAADIECRETSASKLTPPPLDGAKNINETPTKENDSGTPKLESDGGSDSGVDNPAYNDTETTIANSDVKK